MPEPGTAGPPTATEPHIVRMLVAMTGALLVWALFFLLAYGAATLACAPELGAPATGGATAAVILGGLLAASALAVIGFALFARRQFRRSGEAARRFVYAVGLIGAGLVGLAFIANTFPLLVLRGCS